MHRIKTVTKAAKVATAATTAIIAALIFTISGCATAPATTQTPPTLLTPSTPAAPVQAALFGVYALIVLHEPARPTARFNIIWRRLDATNDEIDIRNTFGTTVAQLALTPAGAVLMQQNKQIRASDGDALAAKVLGREIPVNALGYWLRGVPDPTVAIQRSEYNDGDIALLRQHGWSVRYLSRDNQRRPQLIDMRTTDGVQIDIKIRRWL